MGEGPAGVLAHEPCCHTKGGFLSRWPQRRGKRERYFFFFWVFFLPLGLSRCPYMGKPLLGVGEQYCYTHWYVA